MSNSYTVTTTDNGATYVVETVAGAAQDLSNVSPSKFVASVDGATGAVDLSGTYAPTTGPIKSDLSAFGVYLPEAHGAVGDATTDDTAAFTAMEAAIPASGGRVYLSRVYRISTFTSAKPLTIEGAGGALLGDSATSPQRALSGFVSSSTTADCLALTATCTLRDFAVVNDAASQPTAGAGIKISTASKAHLSRVTTLGFFNNWDIFDSAYYTIEGCHNFDPVNYGAYLHAVSSSYYDHGDQGIINTVFSPWTKSWAAASMVRYEGGGGLRFTGNKINGGAQPNSGTLGKPQYGIDLMIADGVGTSVMTITGNSIEGTTAACVRVSTLGPNHTGVFGKVAIVGNEFLPFDPNCLLLICGAGLGAVNNNIRSIVFTGNSISGTFKTGILAYNLRGLTIGPNSWDSPILSGPLIQLAGTGSPDTANAASSTFAVDIAPQSVSGATGITLVQDNRNMGNQGQWSGLIEYDYERHAILTVNGTWTSMWEVDLPSVGGVGALLEVTITGYNADSYNSYSSYLPVTIRQRRALSQPTSGGTVTLATVDADVALGGGAANVAVQYVTTTANTVLVQIQTTSGTQPQFFGRCRIKVDGALVLSLKKS